MRKPRVVRCRGAIVAFIFLRAEANDFGPDIACCLNQTAGKVGRRLRASHPPLIPFLGPLVGVVVLGVVAVVTFASLGHALLVPAVYFLLHSVEANIITPLTLSRRLTLNPLVMFFWLSLWFWLWGVPGALLAVPMLQTLKIFCDNIPPLARAGQFRGR